MHLTSEEKLLFLSSRLNPSNQDIEDIIHVLKSKPKTDYNRLTHLASLNGVAPLVYKNLDKRSFLANIVKTGRKYSKLLRQLQ